ncbi:MAG: hypothetical protein KAT28_04685 [Candidatus Aenigmarchaeota archaeon]|nr:hypothetical protein [Candidatus Aenigmarchaeota archaeon]
MKNKLQKYGKIFLWNSLIVFIILKIVIECHYTEYITQSNIIFPIIISSILSYLIFEYKFKRQQDYKEKQEKVRIYNELREILNAPNNRNKGKIFKKIGITFFPCEINRLKELIEKNQHIIALKIIKIWDELSKQKGYAKDIFDSERRPEGSLRKFRTKHKKLQELIENELKGL